MPRSNNTARKRPTSPKPKQPKKTANDKPSVDPLTVVRSRVHSIEPIVPLWQYISRYVLCVSFNTQDDELRKKIVEAARDVDMALVSLGFESGALSIVESAELQRLADESMKRLPQEI